MLPRVLRPLSGLVKRSIRGLAYARLSYLPLRMDDAEWWAERMKLWPAIFPSPFERRASLARGMQMHLGIVDVIERTLLIEGSWDSNVLQVLDRYLTPGGTFVDVGANIGYFSLYAARIVGAEGLVVAFEPSIRTLHRLSANLRLNNAQNIAVISVAVSNESGMAELRLGPVGNLGSASFRTEMDGQPRERVARLSPDAILGELSVKPDLVKIDVEGHEFAVLDGLRATLARHRPVVVSELTESFYADGGKTIRGVLELMISLGYACYELVAGKELCVRRLYADQPELPTYQTECLFTVAPPAFRVVE